MKKYKYRYIVNDEVDVSIHKTKKQALKEYYRLLNIDYKYKNSLHILRHEIITDIYKIILEYK